VLSRKALRGIFAIWRKILYKDILPSGQGIWGGKIVHSDALGFGQSAVLWVLCIV
jgi:hypothetical protein